MNSSPNSERTRLARELHDGLAAELTSLGYHLDQIIGSNELGNTNRTPLRQVRFSISALISQVRDEIFELRTNEVRSFSDQIERQLSIILANTEIKYEITGEIQIRSELRFELIRAIRELTLNALRHSKCTEMQINLADDQIQISDNGVGGIIEKFDSYGLIGVRERLAKIGARLQIHPTEHGSLIHIKFETQ